MTRKLRVAVVGATGAVGREMIRILEERRFPVSELRLLASGRSAGQTIPFRGEDHPVGVASPDAFQGCDIALFSAGKDVSLSLGPEAWARGCLVIDNSSAWRMDKDVPLVVPEVNPHALDGYKKKGIIGNPNCSTIQMVVALQPLHQAATLRRVIVSTYQSTAGAGQKGIEELSKQTISALNLGDIEIKTFPHQIAFNLIPQIDQFLPDGYTKEERKMIDETRKIMEIPDLLISATCVRVPVFCGHSEAVTLETDLDLSVDHARSLLLQAPGIHVLDSPAEKLYPMPLDSAGRDEVFVGRLRKDPFLPKTLHLWVVSDNLRKGAALNAVQIAEIVLRDYLA